MWTTPQIATNAKAVEAFLKQTGSKAKSATISQSEVNGVASVL